MDWYPWVTAWDGESGSGIVECSDNSCDGGEVRVVGTRWTGTAISALDSVMSGIVTALIKDDVKFPPASVVGSVQSDFSMRMDRGFLKAFADRDGEWQILSLDGRAIGAPTYGRNLFVPADRLPRGVALIVFRAPGQAPITRRWMGR